MFPTEYSLEENETAVIHVEYLPSEIGLDRAYFRMSQVCLKEEARTHMDVSIASWYGRMILVGVLFLPECLQKLLPKDENTRFS